MIKHKTEEGKTRRPYNRKGVLITIAISILVMAICCIFIFYTGHDEIFTLRDDSICIKADKTLAELMNTGNEKDTIINDALIKLAADSEISVKDNLFNAGEIFLDPVYPCIGDNEGYLYLYGRNQKAITVSYLASDIEKGSYISDGKVFDSSFEKTEAEDITMLMFSKNLYMNVIPIILHSSGEDIEIAAFSYIYFENGFVNISKYNDTDISINKKYMNEASIIEIDGTNYFYGTFLYKLGIVLSDNYEAGDKTVEESAIEYKEEMKQYFLGIKYDYPSESKLYKLENGVYIEFEDVRSKLTSPPLITINNNKVMNYILPVSYAVIRPSLSSMASLPVLARLVYKDRILNAWFNDKNEEINGGFLYDGEDTYILPTGAKLRYGDNEKILSDMSIVTVESDGAVSVFNYFTNTFDSYVISGYDIYAVLDEKYSIDMHDDTVLMDGGMFLPLGSKPEYLPEYQR